MEVQDLQAGDWVALHPATDQWMQGVRYATVLHVDRARNVAKLHGCGRTFHVHVVNITEVVERPRVV